MRSLCCSFYGRRTADYGLILALLSGLLVVSSSDIAAAESVLVGVGSATFELPQGVPLAGYSRRKGRPSQGAHDPIGVRALILQDADTTAALISCDVLIIDERLFAAVRRRLPEADLPEDTVLLLAATHTHSGPGAYGTAFFEKLSMGHFDTRVFRHLEDAIIRALREAHAASAAAIVRFATRHTEGLVRNRIDPTGLVDPELTAVAFLRSDRDMPFAVVVGFAAHPTTLGAWNMRLSSDYPGAIRRVLERRLAGSTCLFFAGAVGDQAPVTSGDGYERAEWLGQELANAVLESLRGAAGAWPTTAEARQEPLRLPAARVRLSRSLALPHWIGRRLVDDEATLSLLRVGPVVFFGVPCDLEAALGHRLKAAAQARGLQPVIVGFASDYIGYCVSEQRYRSDAYEARMAFNGPSTGELIVERLIQMLDQVALSTQQSAISK